MSKVFSLHSSPSSSQSIPKLNYISPQYDTLMSPVSYVAPSDQSDGSSSVPPGSAAGSKKKYTCTTCGRGFTTSGHLARHTRIHTGERNHACPFPGCETRCSRQDNLQQHYRIHLSPGSRRTTGKAARDAMQRAIEQQQSRRPPGSAQRASQSAVNPPHARSPTLDVPKGDFAYGRAAHAVPGLSVARFPSPPDEPPRLECAYGSKGSDSVSGESSARSSPAIPSYGSSPPFGAASGSSRLPPYLVSHAAVHDRRTMSGDSDSTPSQWQLRSSSGPDSPGYGDLPSPTGSTAYTCTDSDEAPSPASSHSSHHHHHHHHHSFSHHDNPAHQLTYDYYHNQPHALGQASYPSSRQSSAFSTVEPSTRHATPNLYSSVSYPASSPVSPVNSQPSSPTYATSPIAPAHAAYGSTNDGRQLAGALLQQQQQQHEAPPSLQPSYSSSSLYMAGCSPTDAHPSSRGVQRHMPPHMYDHTAPSHAKYAPAAPPPPSSVMTQSDVRSGSDGRQPSGRTMSYTPIDHSAPPSHHQQPPAPASAPVVHDNRAQEMPAQFGHLAQHQQQPGSHSASGATAHIPYGYSYSPLSGHGEHQQTWRADAMRPRAALVH